MSLENHILRIGTGVLTVEKTLAEWNITSAVVVVGNQGINHDDTLTISMEGKLENNLDIPAFSKAVLLDPDYVIRFVGYLLTTPMQATIGGEKTEYVFHGPWSILSGIGYRQQLNVTVGGITVTSAWMSKVIMNRNVSTGEQVSIRAQVQDVINYAISEGVAVDVDASGLPEFIPPVDQKTDMFCADAIDSQLRWVPEMVAYWDYETFPPILKFTTPDDVNPGVLELPIDAFSGTLSIQPRHDLLVRQMRINYLGKETVEVETATRVFIKVANDTSTEENGSYRQVEQSIQLDRDEAIPATGLAAMLHAPFKTLQYEISGEVQSEEVDWSIVVGKKLKITDLAGVEAVIQTISRDLDTGTTTFQCGPPSHLGLNDMLAMVRKTRQMQSPDQKWDPATGESQDEKDKRVVFDVIENGAVTKYRVSGAERIPDPPPEEGEGEGEGEGGGEEGGGG